MSDLPQDSQYSWMLGQLVERVNGFVYAGDRLNAVVDTVKALRADPVLADRLLARPDAPSGAPKSGGQPIAAADHPHADPGDGRTECEACGKWVFPAIHSCKRVPVTEAARRRAREVSS